MRALGDDDDEPHKKGNFCKKPRQRNSPVSFFQRPSPPKNLICIAQAPPLLPTDMNNQSDSIGCKSNCTSCFLLPNPPKSKLTKAKNKIFSLHSLRRKFQTKATDSSTPTPDHTVLPSSLLPHLLFYTHEPHRSNPFHCLTSKRESTPPNLLSRLNLNPT